jgi:hypothetical protein
MVRDGGILVDVKSVLAHGARDLRPSRGIRYWSL